MEKYQKPFKVLFVCIGNTCRSPMAESILKQYINDANLNWQTDSAALCAWNVGRSPDERCIKVLAENGLTTSHIGRIITNDDFENFDYILCMDDNNLRALQDLAQSLGKMQNTKIELLGSYLERKEDKIIEDPYFTTGIGGFRAAFAQINGSCRNFLSIHK